MFRIHREDLNSITTTKTDSKMGKELINTSPKKMYK